MINDQHNPYAASVVENEDESAEFELAGPWQRIAARIIDTLVFAICFVPMGIGAAMAENKSDSAIGMVLLSSLALLVLGIYQLVIMSKHGHSIGKKAMKIKVVTEDGDNPGFWRYVGMREFLFNIILSIISLIPFIGPVASWGAQIACLVMLFLVDRDRRTLQDLLAKTYVVKA